MFFLAACLAALAGPHVRAATLVVNNTNPAGPGSLPQAILDANATNGLDTIVFQIPGTGVRTINLSVALPTITDSVVLDGTTQTGFAGTPLIELNGASAGTAADGLSLSAGNNTIRGLVINRFAGAGIYIAATSTTNRIEGNYIGTDPTGTLNRGNGWSPNQPGGLLIRSSGNWIGGPYATNRNLISANGGSGVLLQNGSGNTIQGNLIGTSATGAAALGNTLHGVSLYFAAGNLIGGTSATARNVISGNSGSGVFVYTPGSTGTLVQGNYLGTDASGTLAVPNAGDGVTVQDAPYNIIGGTNAGAGNLISGNGKGGVGLDGASADGNLIQGNLIGTDLTGQVALGNALSGVTIRGGSGNLIGGTATAARNLISANKQAGVYLTTNSVGNLVQGNLIGVNLSGTQRLGNAVNGISLDGAISNTIGGTLAAARNIISGNTNSGIEIFNPLATGNLLQGNYIGTDLTGQTALANGYCGVHIQSPANTVGGRSIGAGNLISGNRYIGVWLDRAQPAFNVESNVVQGNFIGTDASGTTGLMNVFAGIGISDAPRNSIGGTDPGAGNLVSANADANSDAGIFLTGSGATGNVIQGNKLGTDVTGTLPLGNTHEGIYLQNGASTNTIGGIVPGAGNLVSGNKTWGIYLVNAPGNVIQGNLIGTALDGVSALGNTFHAVECAAGSCHTIIGGSGAAGNRIAFTKTIYAGVRIRDGSTNNAILGNAIFANGALGIDLSGVGVTANDACDPDGGANMLQNCPVLAQAVTGNGTTIRGTLNSRPNQPLLLQFFANPACDGAGAGEGQIYLGQQSVTTSNNCLTSFVASFPGSVPMGYVVTATATDGANNTSEFSACIPVGPVPALAVSPAPGQQATLAWTNTAAGFVLKQTSSLSPVIQWTTVTNTPVLSNGQFVVTVSTTNSSRFYRLSFE